MSSLSFLVENLDEYEGPTELKDRVKKYFDLEISSRRIKDLFITLFVAEFKEFTEGDQKKLEKTIEEGINDIAKGNLTKEQTQRQYNELYNSLHEVYIKKFTSQLRTLDFAKKKCHLDFDMDFSLITVNVLNNSPKMDRGLKTTLKEESDKIHRNFVEHLKKELFKMYNVYCEVKML